MDITHSQEGTQLTVTLNGRLDTASAPELEDFLKNRLEGLTLLILDLAGIDYVSSAGLRVILSTQKALKTTDAFKIINVNSDVMDVFEMTGFADILTIESI